MRLNMPGMKYTLFLIAVAFATVLAATGIGYAGFQSPESVVRNVYAYYGEGTQGPSRGLPHEAQVAENFFDTGLRGVWIASTPPFDFFVQASTWRLGPVQIATTLRQFDRTYVTASFSNRNRPVSLNFIVVRSPDGWVIFDVESTHDSLRMFLSRLKN